MQTLRVPTSITEQEEVQVEVTRLLVECYFDIVRANLQVCRLAAPLDQPLLRSHRCIMFQSLMMLLSCAWQPQKDPLTALLGVSA